MRALGVAFIAIVAGLMGLIQSSAGPAFNPLIADTQVEQVQYRIGCNAPYCANRRCEPGRGCYEVCELCPQFGGPVVGGRRYDYDSRERYRRYDDDEPRERYRTRQSPGCYAPYCAQRVCGPGGCSEVCTICPNYR